jgi:hypothetical protein
MGGRRGGGRATGADWRWHCCSPRGYLLPSTQSVAPPLFTHPPYPPPTLTSCALLLLLLCSAGPRGAAAQLRPRVRHLVPRGGALHPAVGHAALLGGQVCWAGADPGVAYVGCSGVMGSRVVLYVACWACRSSGGGRWVRSISSLQTGLPTAASRTCSFPHLSQQRLAPPLQRCLLGCTLCPALYCLPCTACPVLPAARRTSSPASCAASSTSTPRPGPTSQPQQRVRAGGWLGGWVGEWASGRTDGICLSGALQALMPPNTGLPLASQTLFRPSCWCRPRRPHPVPRHLQARLSRRHPAAPLAAQPGRGAGQAAGQRRRLAAAQLCGHDAPAQGGNPGRCLPPQVGAVRCEGCGQAWVVGLAGWLERCLPTLLPLTFLFKQSCAQPPAAARRLQGLH